MHKLTGDIALVTLPEEPLISDKLTAIADSISGDSPAHLVLDFSQVEILTSASISKLIVLRELLCKLESRLIVCNVSAPTRCILKTVGIESMFQFCNDKMMALEELEHTQQTEPAS